MKAYNLVLALLIIGSAGFFILAIIAFISNTAGSASQTRSGIFDLITAVAALAFSCIWYYFVFKKKQN